MLYSIQNMPIYFCKSHIPKLSDLTSLRLKKNSLMHGLYKWETGIEYEPIDSLATLNRIATSLGKLNANLYLCLNIVAKLKPAS